MDKAKLEDEWNDAVYLDPRKRTKVVMEHLFREL